MKACLKKPRRGFTLIELMVAMAITTIIVTILITITSVSLNTWNRSRAEIRAARQAQAMTEIMARDFEAMVTRPGNNFEWLIAKTSVVDSIDGIQSPNSSDIIFFTAATDRYEGQIGVDGEDLGGDISAVGYTLEYKDPIDTAGSNFPTFVLYRKLVNPDETFANLLGKDDLEVAFGGLVNAEIGETENFVCENIYQYSITFHLDRYDDVAGTFRTIPVTLSHGENTSLQIFGDRIALNDVDENSRISAVEISLTVISDNAMNSLRRNPNMNEESKNQLISSNSFQYSKRIEVPRM